MFALLLVLACTPMHTPVAVALPPSVVATAPVTPAPVGSLWSDVQGRQMIGMDNNSRRVGDLVTVIVTEADSTTIGASTNASRASSAEFGIEALLGLETSIVKANPNMTGGIGIKGGTGTAMDGTGETSRNGTLEAVITCQVTEVLANGNLRVRGTKEIRVNRENQYLILEGIVRPRDIRLDNTVASNLIAELRTEFSGQGVVANQQGQGWATTVANTIWPF